MLLLLCICLVVVLCLCNDMNFDIIWWVAFSGFVMWLLCNYDMCNFAPGYLNHYSFL